MRKLIRSWVPVAVLAAMLGSGPSAAASLSPTPAAAASPAAVRDCGTGPALVKPTSMILTCADDGELAGHLVWSSWTPAQATASGTVKWRVCTPDCAQSTTWESTSANFTLTRPVQAKDSRVLFTRMRLQVTGRTPRGFMRDVVFSMAPATASPPRPGKHLAKLPPPAPSGSLGYGNIEGYWIYAGGPSGSAGSYTYPQIAAAITGAESSFLPGIIQPGVDYCGPGADRAGWGLWQITCGNSVPQYGTDFQILDPWNNAEEAVYKYDQAGGFSPWSTYTSGAYTAYLQHTGANLDISDPGEYVQINSTPPGTPSSPPPAPGSTYGPPMPNAATAYVFWKGQDSNLWQAQGAANGALAGPTNRGMGPLNSQPAVGIDGNGATYVYWRGNGPSYDLWEAYWNGSAWVGPFNRGMGPLGSAPTVAVTSGGTAFVFWKGNNNDLWEAQGSATGSLSGPYDRGMGPLGSAPTAGVNSSGSTFVYWEGTAPQDALWEAYWNGSSFAGPYDRGMGPLGSPPSVAVTGGGTAYVFWKGQDSNLWEAQGPASGSLSGPFNRGMGPLGSAPTTGVASNGYTYTYWQGTGPQYELWEAYWNGSGFVGPDNRGMGPLGSAPTVAIKG
ncbi:MAG TPA: hypothetical protein VKS82_00440 [Streptosporangiaceae bacterium]|nr:hypothetical protein [Streptosporangiaceae bacterium]